MDTNVSEKPVVGIGACLTGEPVRYNGDSKRSSVSLEQVREYLQLRSFCPEMAIGLGVPREPIRLVDEQGTLQVRTAQASEQDYSPALAEHASHVLASQPDICGYILVKGSPSCGYERVKRYSADGKLLGRDARGIFAQALHHLDPLLPLEDDGRLCDPALKESFLCRVYLYHRWQKLLEDGLSATSLLNFYSDNKHLVMSHDYGALKKLGRLLSNAGKADIVSLGEELIADMMAALTRPARRGAQANTLQHIQGYLRKYISSGERKEMAHIIDRYRVGEVPLVVPITLLRHHFKKFPVPYIDRQTFLYPYPDELQLRNLI
jgi:uncharacterized protein YbgA (DUF1722 family)/uncharacterized protein YbbK (DUF523 family)